MFWLRGSLYVGILIVFGEIVDEKYVYQTMTLEVNSTVYFSFKHAHLSHKTCFGSGEAMLIWQL